MIFNDEEFLRFLFKAIQSSKTKQPYRCDGYYECCEHAEEMAVHLYGEKPIKLLTITRPREDPETKKYRLESYQPTTKATSEKAISILAKIFNTSLYSIVWKEKTDAGEKLSQYLLNQYPTYNSVMSMLHHTVLKKMICDPNGIIAIRPKNLLIDSSERAMPIAKIYGSSVVWYRDEEIVIVFLKSADDKDKGKVYYFEYYDENFIIEFQAYVNRSGVDYTSLVVEETALYPHDCEELPVWQLGGIPEAQDNGTIMYRSYFDGALPFWNQAVIHESDLHGAYINHMHPIRAELAEECDYNNGQQKCRLGEVLGENGDTSECPRCQGTGYKSVKSPYGVYQYNREKLSGETGSGGLTPVQYITIPTDATKMLEDRVEGLHEKGLNAINMDIVNKVGANQSGVAKVIDRSELYDFMTKISDQIFSVHLNNIIYYTNIQQFKPQAKASLANPSIDENLPEINKPVNFDIASAEALIANIETIKKAGLSPEFLKQAEMKIAAKQFSTDTESLNKMMLQIQLDPISDVPTADIISLQSGMQKMWTTEEQTVHYNLSNFIDRALLENKNFLTLNSLEQKEVLIGYAKEQMKVTKVTIDPSQILDSTYQTGKIENLS